VVLLAQALGRSELAEQLRGVRIATAAYGVAAVAVLILDLTS
jgi:hypothetical protein